MTATDIAVERGFSSFAEHLNMLLDEAYVDEESCDPDEEKKTEDDSDNIISLAGDEETAAELAATEWSEQEVETVERKDEERQGRVRSGSTEYFKLTNKSHPINFLSVIYFFMHTSR